MMQGTTMEENDFLHKIIEKIQGKCDSKLIFGEPFEEEGRKIITVGQIHYRFAGGSGSGQGGSEPIPGAEQPEVTSISKGSGSGGFGAVRVDPVGIIEITPEETKFIPIHQGWGFVLAFFGGLLLGWLLHRK